MNFTKVSTLAPPADPARPLEGPDDIAEFRWTGITTLRTDEEQAGLLGSAVLALAKEGWPPVFAYVFEALWLVGEAIRERVSTVIGERYELLADGWAWVVDGGRAGWPRHRGTNNVLDRDAPELVNVWIALSDVAVDQACIHAVPLGEDADYPHNLNHFNAEVVGRPFPLRCGETLFWNANVLHWGGHCANGQTPRVSCSFSLGRARRDTPFADNLTLSDLTFEKRLELIATMIETYGTESEISPEFRRWASATVALGAFISRRKEG